MENKRYWKSLEELNNDPAFTAAAMSEFGKDVPVEELMVDAIENGTRSNRRDFLKFFGFSLTAATLAACNRPAVKYAIPYVNNPTDEIPSIANYYASFIYDGQDYSSVLVKTREGRPIKIEGNQQSPVTKGAVLARAHASVLGVYDEARLRKPVAHKGDYTWDKADAELPGRLAETAAAGKDIVVLTDSIISPTTKAVLAEFAKKYATVRHITYDASSASAILEANKIDFGKAFLPDYHFEAAEVIVGVNADFLGTWLNATRYIGQYAEGRKLNDNKKTMSRHIQFESTMSITGSNADYRAAIRPSQEGALILNLYTKVAEKLGRAGYNAPKLELAGNTIALAAEELVAHAGKALLVCGSNDLDIQLLVNSINEMVGAYGSTIQVAAPANLRQGLDADFAGFLADAKAGKVGAVLVYNANPAYTYPDTKAVTDAFAAIPLKISFADHNDETAVLADYLLPDVSPFEGWSDAEPYAGSLVVSQPTIVPLAGELPAPNERPEGYLAVTARPFQVSLLRWSGNNAEYYDYIRDYWREHYYPKQNEYTDFENFWQHVLERGFYETGEAKEKAASPKVNGEMLGVAANSILQGYEANVNGLELFLYQKIGIGEGRQANNPWLQELPDPISRNTWDNYVCVGPKYAEANKLKDSDVVSVELAGGKRIELPLFVQPGIHPNVVAIAVGYGRSEGVGKCASTTGKNAFRLASLVNGAVQPYAKVVKLTKVKDAKDVDALSRLAGTQGHQSMMGRDIVKETSLAEFVKNPYSGNEDGQERFKTLWQRTHDFTGHWWAMVIDQNACTGCGSCVISCQVENNIAVVGKDQVQRGREMHWLRIDRYYAGTKPKDRYDEHIADNPTVVFQPMLCQHCSNAPCETVCPVLATVHSSEGLNQMVYNRCVGTRYCANNCPYKVRRFNWYDFTSKEHSEYNPATNDLGRMVLNPDVTVRARGVMEKCSFCVQRLQAAKLQAKKDGRRPSDDELQTACSQSCPAGAIIFGDLNDPESRVAKLFKTERSYAVLAEIKTLPSVHYLTKVRNVNERVEEKTEAAEPQPKA